MSYSLNIRAATKDAAMAAVTAALENVSNEQPEHTIDLRRANMLAQSLIGMLYADPDMDIMVVVSGSISTRDIRVANPIEGNPDHMRDDTAFTQAAASCSAYLIARE